MAACHQVYNHVTSQLTAYRPGLAPAPMLVLSMETTFIFLT